MFLILGILAVLGSLLYLMKRNGNRASLNTCTGWVRY